MPNWKLIAAVFMALLLTGCAATARPVGIPENEFIHWTQDGVWRSGESATLRGH